MSGQPDTSDDLIAELAKLMATNAKPEPQPTAAAKPQQPAIRIPGLDLPAAGATAAAPRPAAAVVPLTLPHVSASAPQPANAQPVVAAPQPEAPPPQAAPAVRIPGMPNPIQAAPVSPAPTPSPVPQAVAPAIVDAAPAPTVRIPGMPSPGPAAAAPMAEARKTVVDMPFVAPRPAPAAIEPALPPAVERKEPTLVAAQPPKPAEKPAAPAPEPNFDFAFDLSSGSGKDESKPEEHDPIAEIIAAELAASAPPPPAAPAAPASVKVVPRPAAAGPMPAKFATARPSGPMPHSNPQRPGPINFGAPGGGRLQPATPITLKPVNNNARPAAVALPVESDAFAVAPALALGPKPVQPAPANTPNVPVLSERPATSRPMDPLDEIESLIGAAVRVDHSAEPKPAPAPVAPMTTAFAPRRTEIAEPRQAAPAPTSAEEAILAAAAATGADVPHVEATDMPPFQKPPKGKKMKAPRTAAAPARERRAGGFRQYVGMGFAAALLVAAGFGLYWVLGIGRGGDPSTAPVLTADVSPVKETPAIVESNVAQPRSVVMDELEGNTAVAATETLVSTDETQVDVAAVTATPDVTEAGLANRRVRTVTVRPDGTIVSGDDTVAGNEALPVARPNVPALPDGGGIDASDLLTAAAQTVAGDPIAAVIANPDAAATAPAVTALVDPGTTTAVDPTTVAALPATTDPNTPVPMPRLMNRPTEPMVTAAVPTSAVNAVVSEPVPSLQTAVTPEPQATPEPPVAVAAVQPAQTASPAAAYIQLSSQRSEADARAALRGIQERWGSMLTATPEIHRADLGARGIYYRVRVPMGSRAEAARMCQQITNAGGDCFVP